MRIVIADDHPLIRGALRSSVTALVGNVDILEAGSFEELAPAFSSGTVDLVLLDLTMPGVQGFSGLLYLRAYIPLRRLSSYRAMKTVPLSAAALSLVRQAIFRNRLMVQRWD